ncbi:complex 1 protein-domain-containing protein [Thermoascus aurantiacus ATCC 26904]
MRPSIRLLAAISHGEPSSKLKKPVLGLEEFIQRQRVLGLWREILRALKKVPKSPTRDELRNHARYEFERNRHVTDLSQIRYLLSTGKTEFDTIKRYIDQQIAR